MKQALMMTSMFALMSEQEMRMFSEHDGDIIKRQPTKKEPPNPKGTKPYFFNQFGEFVNGRMKKEDCVFICVSINDKNATRKFNKWKERNK